MGGAIAAGPPVPAEPAGAGPPSAPAMPAEPVDDGDAGLDLSILGNPADPEAVARLAGKQCQGCHLELSAAEIDTVKDEAAETGVTDCPDCGRLLIV